MHLSLSLCSSWAGEVSTVYYYYYYVFNWTANGFLPSGSGTTIRHNTKMHISHKISHHAQTKHSSQSYTNNKGHIIQIKIKKHYINQNVR
jgi:hypothetical protein